MKTRNDLGTKHPVPLLPGLKYEKCMMCIKRLNGQENKKLNSLCTHFGVKVKAGDAACYLYLSDGIPF